MAMHFDELLINHIGQFGLYQRLVLLALSLVAIGTAIQNLIQVFAGQTPPFQCDLNYTLLAQSLDEHLDNHSDTLNWEHNVSLHSTFSDKYNEGDRCFITRDNTSVRCSKWIYDTYVYSSTIVTEWDLVCSQRWLPALAQSLHMAGCLFGGLLFGQMADKYGRHKALLATICLEVSCGILTAFSVNFAMYAAMRFIMGMAIAGQFNCAYILAIELVGPKWRTLAGMAMLYMYSMGTMLLAGLAFLVRDWSLLSIVTSVPFVTLLLYQWLVPESPRWLMAQDQSKAAYDIARKIARSNKRSMPESGQLLKKSEATQSTEEDQSLNMLHLFKTPNIRFRTLILCFLWFSTSTSYYGLSLYTSSLGSNDFLSLFLAGLVEIPAYTFTLLSINRFGRRLPLAGCLIVAGANLLSTWLLPDEHHTARLVLAMLGKLCISSAFATMYPISVEIFPTVLRNAGLGLTSTGGKIGGFISPYINLMGEISRVIPLIIFGGMAFAGGMLVFFLPETHQQPLPESVEDAESMQLHCPCWKSLSKRGTFLEERVTVEPVIAEKEKFIDLQKAHA